MTKQAETRTDFGHVTQTFHVKLLLFHMHNEQKRAFPLMFWRRQKTKEAKLHRKYYVITKPSSRKRVIMTA